MYPFRAPVWHASRAPSSGPSPLPLSPGLPSLLAPYFFPIPISSPRISLSLSVRPSALLVYYPVVGALPRLSPRARLAAPPFHLVPLVGFAKCGVPSSGSRLSALPHPGSREVRN